MGGSDLVNVRFLAPEFGDFVLYLLLKGYDKFLVLADDFLGGFFPRKI